MSTIINNPFTKRSMISEEDKFVGRSREIDNILTRIRNGDSVSLVGDRRIGKSSLLYHLVLTGKDRLENPPYHEEKQVDIKFIYLDLLDARVKTVKGFCNQICKALDTALSVSPDEEDPLEYLAALGDALSGLQDNKTNPVFLLDEFETLLKKNSRFNDDFFEALRSFANSHLATFVTASKHDLKSLTDQNDNLTSPFWNIFTIQRLDEFAVDDTRDEVSEFLAHFWQGDLTPNEFEQAFLLSYCSRHPLVMQVVSYWVLKNRELLISEIALKMEIENELNSFFRDWRDEVSRWLRKDMINHVQKANWAVTQIEEWVKALSPFSIKIGK